METDKNLAHEEIWDDSALVDSWNQALDEYKKYHSIHAAGGTVDDIIEQTAPARRDAKPETDSIPEPIANHGAATSDETEVQEAATAQDAEKIAGPPQEASQNGGVPPVLGPQMLLGSVQDEDMKKLLMSWYYAGYYTGLFEGKRQTQSGQQ